MKFVKMHGAGNDYVYVDCTDEELGNPQETARRDVLPLLFSPV